MQKKLFGAILVLCLLLGMLMALPAAAADNVVEIKTADDLLKLMNYDSDLSKAETNADGSAKWSLSGTYVLGDDIDLRKKTIDLKQKPIGTHPDADADGNARCFTGKFYGEGHTIKGVAINTEANYVGFFGVAGRGAEIKELKLEGSVINTKNATGGLVGYGRDTLTLENCEVTMTVSCVARAAGIIGGYDAMTENSTLVIKNCINRGNISCTKEQAAGIVGRIVLGAKGSSAEITECKNYGIISTIDLEAELKSGAIGTYAGGIAAYVQAKKANTEILIQDCINYKGADISARWFVGGIIGRLETSSGSTATFNYDGKVIRCNNYASVTCYSDTFTPTQDDPSYAFTGGIVGMVTASAQSLTVTECYNEGTVTGSNDTQSYTGGIVGYIRSYYVANRSAITNCYNNGTVQCDYGYVGGIAGGSPKVNASSVNSLVSGNVNNVAVSGKGTKSNTVADTSYATIENTFYNSGKTQDMSELDATYWVIGTTRSEPRSLHDTHFYEPTTAGKHNCPCGEAVEADCTYEDYACKYCGYAQPTINLTITALDPNAGTVAFDGVVGSADVSLNFSAIKVEKIGEEWIASNFVLTGDDASHYSLTTETFVFTPTAGDIITVTADGETYEVYKGQSLTLLADVPADGYQFDGWYDENEALVSSDREYTFTPTADVTLTPCYSLIPVDNTPNNDKINYNNNIALFVALAARNNRQCVITYKSTGANIHVFETVKKGTVLQMPEAPTKEGYTFVGWYKDINGTKPFNFNAKITGNVSIYAKWVKN